MPNIESLSVVHVRILAKYKLRTGETSRLGCAVHDADLSFLFHHHAFQVRSDEVVNLEEERCK